MVLKTHGFDGFDVKGQSLIGRGGIQTVRPEALVEHTQVIGYIYCSEELFKMVNQPLKSNPTSGCARLPFREDEKG